MKEELNIQIGHTCETCFVVFYTPYDTEEDKMCSFCQENIEKLKDKKFLLERRLDVIETTKVLFFPTTLKLMYEVLSERNNNNDQE